jgi:hypothetical protein
VPLSTLLKEATRKQGSMEKNNAFVPPKKMIRAI